VATSGRGVAVFKLSVDTGGKGVTVFKLSVDTGGSTVDPDVIGVECRTGNTVVAELGCTAGNTETGVGIAGSLRLEGGALCGVSLT